MVVLIVGSKGFIGSNCLKYFKQVPGYEVLGCDVVVDYIAADYFLLDVSNSDYNELFEQREFGVCVNCSGAASVPDSLQHPLRDYYLNTLNVFKMLEAIRHFNPLCKFINLSSAAVYGNPVSLPVKEDAALKPLSPYGRHKKMAEEICNEFFHSFGLRTCSARIFSAYGDGLKKQLFWDLYQKGQQGNKVKLYGNGNESRDFINIQDLVRAIHLLIECADFNGEVYNIANGEEIFIKDVVTEFYDTMGWKGEVIFTGKHREGDPDNWRADISKIKEMGFYPEYNISKGLNQYIGWLRENGLG